MAAGEEVHGDVGDLRGAGNRELLLFGVYGAFAFTTLAMVSHEYLGIPQTWTAFGLIWMLSVSIWCAMDWTSIPQAAIRRFYTDGGS